MDVEEHFVQFFGFLSELVDMREVLQIFQTGTHLQYTSLLRFRNQFHRQPKTRATLQKSNRGEICLDGLFMERGVVLIQWNLGLIISCEFCESVVEFFIFVVGAQAVEVEPINNLIHPESLSFCHIICGGFLQMSQVYSVFVVFQGFLMREKALDVHNLITCESRFWHFEFVVVSLDTV